MSQVIGFGFGFESLGSGGSGTLTGGGTPPKMPVWTGANSLGDSQVSDNGTTVFIGTSATSTSAMFEVKSTTQGALFPRMTTTQRDAIPVGTTEDSLFIYNTSIMKYQFYDDTAGLWQTIESSIIGGETWSQTLTNGAISGGVSPQMSNGDVIKAVNGGGQLNLRSGGNGIFDLTNDNGGFTQSWYSGNITSVSFGFGALGSIVQSNTSTTISRVDNLHILINSTNGVVGIQSNNTKGIGMGIATPHSSAKLDITSTTKGFLTPRMTSSQRTNIVTPATGLLVYQTDGTAGFYYYNGSVWVFNGIGTDGIYGGSGIIPTSVTATLTDNLTFGTDLLYLDETSSKIGIGTATPTSIVDITNNANSETKLSINNSTAGTSAQSVLSLISDTTSFNLVSNSSLIATDSSDAIVSVTGGNTIFTNQTTTKAFWFRIGNTTKFAIHGTSGNVGINMGQTIPSAKVQIQGSGSTSTTTSLLVGNSSNTNIFTIRDDGAWVLGSLNTLNAWALTTTVVGYANTQQHNLSVILGSTNIEDPLVSRESVIIGQGSRRLDDVAFGYAIVIGSTSTVTGSGISIGRTTTAGSGVAVGTGANSTGGGTAVGANAQASTSLGTAFGAGSNAGYRALALGNEAAAGSVSGQYNIAIGWKTSVQTGNHSIGIGYLASVTGASTVVIGDSATDSGTGSGVAIGNQCIINSTDSTCVGIFSVTSDIKSTAIGFNVESSGAGAIMIGRGMASISSKVVNSTANSVGFGWEETTPSVLFAKTANQYIVGTGNLGVGTKVPLNKFTVSPLQYNVGTASQSLTTITGVLTTFTASMVGSHFIFEDGTDAGLITSFTSSTSIEVSTSATVAVQPFTIHYIGFQVDNLGNVGIGISSPTALFHIKAGTSTASTSPLKFTVGTLMTVAETGAMEFASDFFYLTANAVRTAISTFGRSVANTATYTALITDRIIGVTRTATGIATINLPSAGLYPNGYQITIMDEGLNASTFNITIDASASQTINGNLTEIINVDADSRTIYSNGVDSWFIM